MSPRQTQSAKPGCVNYVNWSLGTLVGPGGKWAYTKALGRTHGPAARVQRQTGAEQHKWRQKSLSLPQETESSTSEETPQSEEGQKVQL